MLRSLYSGISGMKGSQTQLDVVGNNIANVNTAGFKKGRVSFQDVMSQTVSSAQGAQANGIGGINPSQVGTGSQVGAIDTIDTQGNRQTTNRTLDLALEGNGMFVLSSTANPGDIESEDISFSRAGNFYLDEEGYLVNSSGLYVMNTDLERIQVPADATNISIETNGTVQYTSETADAAANTQIGLAQFSNTGGLSKNGDSTYSNTDNAGLIGVIAPEEEGMASVISGALEMSNVDLAEEFTNMIVAQRGFQANTRIITTSDQILEELVNLKR